MRQRRDGFSLLELLLASAILMGAVAVLGELTRLGNQSARSAELLTQAQLLAESKLAEIAAGCVPPDPATDLVFEEEPRWVYSLEQEAGPLPGLIRLRLTVRQAAETPRVAAYTLSQWLYLAPAATDGYGPLPEAGEAQPAAQQPAAADRPPPAEATP